jgi:hypothetical protein
MNDMETEFYAFFFSSSFPSALLCRYFFFGERVLLIVRRALPFFYPSCLHFFILPEGNYISFYLSTLNRTVRSFSNYIIAIRFTYIPTKKETYILSSYPYIRNDP